MKTVKNDLNSLLNDGFTERFAKKYLNDLKSENPALYDKGFFEWAHSKGFLASSASHLSLSNDNLNNYVSDYDYYRIWPNDSWLMFWHNDKLSVKYFLNGTEYSHYLPEYYFYYLPYGNNMNGGLRRLLDSPSEAQDINAFIAALKEKHVFACKPNNGGRCVGFHKLSYLNNHFFIDDKETTEDDISNFVFEHPNYLYTEYIVAGCGMEKIHPLIHTIRVLVINDSGNNPQVIGGYLRFPNESTGTANYVSNGDTQFAYVCNIDIQTGRFFDGTICFLNKTIKNSIHPSYNVLAEGTIPFWKDIFRDSVGMAKLFFGSEVLGFDFGITPNGPKLMEINTFPGLHYIQMFKPLLSNDVFKNYYVKKLKKINNLSETDKQHRNRIK